MGQCPGLKLSKFDDSSAPFLHVILAPLIAFPSATVDLSPQAWLHLRVTRPCHGPMKSGLSPGLLCAAGVENH